MLQAFANIAASYSAPAHLRPHGASLPFWMLKGLGCWEVSPTRSDICRTTGYVLFLLCLALCTGKA